jgi:beta-N-acetylhexosaminidase
LAEPRYNFPVKTPTFLLALVLSVAFLGGQDAVAGQTRENSDLADQILQSLSPRERVEQLFVVGLRGPEASPEVQQFIADRKVGGVYLSQANCNIYNGTAYDLAQCDELPDETDPDTPAQVSRLTQQLQTAACQATKGTLDGVPYCLPLFIAIDHEGDDRPYTRLLNRFTPIPSNMAVGATFDPGQAEAVGCIVGKELAAVGINMLFGPDLDVLDVPRSGGPGDQGIRVFGGDPGWVSEMGAAYIRGVQTCSEGRLATVAKHFPGHGRSIRDVDEVDVPVVVGKKLSELAHVDLAPFAAVAQGKPGEPGVADGMMNSHLSYAEVAGCKPGTPVTFDSSCMQAFVNLPGIALPNFTAWRQAGGLTIADDLAAGAVLAYAQEEFGSYPQGEIAYRALMAGNDLLPLIQPWQYRALEPTVDYLVSRYEGEEAVRGRVDEAVRKAFALKYRLYQGLGPGAVTGATEHGGIVGQAESAGKVTSIVEGALTFLRPGSLEEFRNTMPAPTASDRILFIESWDDYDPPLWPPGKLAALAMEVLPGRVSAENVETIRFGELASILEGRADEATAALEEADWLVFAFLELGDKFPDRQLLKELLRRPGLVGEKRVVVFAYNTPYHLDAGEFRNVDLFVGLYSKVEPALRTSLKVLFQDPTIFRPAVGRGSLPVDYVYDDFVSYDLSEQVEPDPDQEINLERQPEQPVEGEEFTVSLAEPLLARNGHRVANGTPVEFAFELPDGTLQEVPTETADGVASAGPISSQSGEVQITIKSGDGEWFETITVEPAEPPEPLNGGRDAVVGPTEGGDAGFPVVLVASLAGAAPLAAAAGALLLYRRSRRRRVMPKAPTPTQVEPELRVDLATRRVSVGGKDVVPPLSREQYELLAHLCENAGKLCGREEIIRRVWPQAEVSGVSEEAVDSLVHRLRERLRAAGVTRAIIVTIRGQGFRLDL